MANPLSNNGLLMPDDFDNVTYDAVQQRISKNTQSIDGEDRILAKQHFAGAWNGVSYRFRACSDHNRAFTQSIKSLGDAPVPEERYLQERELFAFFVSGLAVLESFCYGLYAVASILRPADFPLKTEGEQKYVTPDETRDKFKAFYEGENIAGLLCGTIRTKGESGHRTEYKKWKDIRNILAHRIVSPRAIFLSVNTEQRTKSAQLKMIPDVELDSDTTATRFDWLAKTINDLMKATDNFTLVHFP